MNNIICFCLGSIIVFLYEILKELRNNMTVETYDNLKQYVGSKDNFTDDLLNMGYEKEHDAKVRADAIDECINSIVNTPSKIGTHLKEPQKVDTCLTMLADRQIEIIDILNQLKE